VHTKRYSAVQERCGDNRRGWELIVWSKKTGRTRHCYVTDLRKGKEGILQLEKKIKDRQPNGLKRRNRG